MGLFQSTPLHEGRPKVVADFARQLLFQSTPLHEGRPDKSPVRRRRKKFQSTPLHEGRLRPWGLRWWRGIVSIHAPA